MILRLNIRDILHAQLLCLDLSFGVRDIYRLRLTRDIASDTGSQAHIRRLMKPILSNNQNISFQSKPTSLLHFQHVVCSYPPCTTRPSQRTQQPRSCPSHHCSITSRIECLSIISLSFPKWIHDGWQFAPSSDAQSGSTSVFRPWCLFPLGVADSTLSRRA